MNPFANQMLFNPGEAFNSAFHQGRQQRIEEGTQNALVKYATNPEDPEVFGEMARYNPQMAMQLRERQQQQHMQGLEAHRENILKGAQLIRQVRPKDQAGWQQVLGLAQQMGIDLAEVPQQFDPQYVNGIVSIADAFAPQKQATAPSSVQEYEYAKSQGFPGDYMAFIDEKRGPMIAANGDGTFTIVPRSMAQGGQAPPPPPAGFVLDNEGGQMGAGPSGVFPR